MKNKAFTLAEVLITLGIIGVIAALTMPTMVNNGAKAKIGPELASAVSTLSEGIRLFMDANNADYLSVAMKKAGLADTSINTLLTTLTDKGSEFYCIKTTGKASFEGKATAYSGDEEATEAIGHEALGTQFILANGSVIGAETADMRSRNIVFYTSSAANIYKKDRKKMRMGLHVFLLTVTDDGEVKGAGGPYHCTKAGMKDGTATGHGCAADIEKNGWKVFY